MSINKAKTLKHRSLAARLAAGLLVLCLAASVCLYGCFCIILKGPYRNYSSKFVKQICTETHLRFLCDSILGSEAVDEIMASAVKEDQEQ